MIGIHRDARVLVVAAHPDDETLGCGGTIARFREAGAAVRVFCLAEGVTARYDAVEFQRPTVRAEIAQRAANGRRALALIETVLKTDKSTNAGEALAMALAELGRYEEAAGVQRDLIAAARQAGDQGLARTLGEQLSLYEARQPSRTVWRTDEAGRAR